MHFNYNSSKLIDSKIVDLNWFQKHQTTEFSLIETFFVEFMLNSTHKRKTIVYVQLQINVLIRILSDSAASHRLLLQ